MPDAATLEKVRKYCAYQERCQQEVRRKLSQEGIWGDEAEAVIADLISSNFINEERYARAFCRGKFRISKWGRRKITAALKQKQLSAYCINAGLSEISEKEYREVLRQQIGKQKGKSAAAILRLMAGRGFEPDLIQNVLKAEPER